MEAMVSLFLSAMTGEKVASPSVGQSVLVFCKFFGEGQCGNCVKTARKTREDKTTGARKLREQIGRQS